MNDPNWVDPAAWEDVQEVMYGAGDRRLSPRHPKCASCGKGFPNRSQLAWIDLGDGGTSMPKVAIHLDCCDGRSHEEIVKLALESLPAAFTGRHTKEHPVMPRVWGRRH